MSDASPIRRESPFRRGPPLSQGPQCAAPAEAGGTSWGSAFDLRGDPLPLERWEWDIRFAGVRAGTAYLEIRREPDRPLRLEAACRNAPWYERIYRIDDHMRSTLHPEGRGSTGHETRFREGRFAQDQWMEIRPDGIRIRRRQRGRDGWRSWTEQLPGHGGPLDDPLTAFLGLCRLPRRFEGPQVFPVFTGRRVEPLVAVSGGHHRVRTRFGRLRCQQIRIREQRPRSRHAPELVVHLGIPAGPDARRFPARVSLHTRVGTFRAEITDIRPEPGFRRR